MFSDEWHKLSELVFRVKGNIRFSRHVFQNKPAYVASIPSSNAHIKLSINAYFFVQLFDGSKTLAQVWEAFNEHEQRYFSKGDVVDLIRNLADKSFLQSNNYANYKAITEDKAITKEREIESKWYSFLFIQIPLFTPNRLFKFLYQWLSFLFTKFAVLLYVLFISYVVITFLPESNSFAKDNISGLLSPSNLPWLYLVIVLSKLLHECAHGLSCAKYKGQVTTLGVMLLVLTPLPFVDVTSMWANPDKKKRMIVSSAGIFLDSLLAAVALIVWVKTSNGMINSIAYNTFFVAFASTLFLNLNPLIKFDGYHILSDAIEIPNLQEKSTRFLKFVWKRYVGGDRQAVNPAQNRREFGIYLVYGILSFFYKILLMLTISYAVSLRFLLFGKILAITAFILYILKPMITTITNAVKEKDPYVKRRFGFFYLGCAIIAAVLAFVPLPSYSRAKGIVASQTHQVINLETTGTVRSVAFAPGQYVKKGQVLLTLENLELLSQIKQVENSLAASQRSQRAYIDQPDLLKILQIKIKSLSEQLVEIRAKYDKNIIKANQDGFLYYDPDLVKEGNTLTKGQSVIKIANHNQLYFSAVIYQTESAYFFMQAADQNPEFKIYGLEDRTFTCKNILAIPASKSELPSASLGFLLGGDVLVDQRANNGTQALENFFELRGEIEQEVDFNSLKIIPERRGEIRYYIGNKTILSRCYLWVRKVLQKDHRV